MTCSAPARDKLLKLLECAQAPMRRSEIGEALAWSRERVSQVVTPLVVQDVVAEMQVPAWAQKGQRPRVYTLESRAVVPAAARRALRPDTIVLTPMGLEARVVCIPPDGHIELELLGFTPREDSYVELWWKLLRPFQPGRLPPQPARVAPCLGTHQYGAA